MIRRTMLAAAASGLLLLTAACGGGGKNDDDPMNHADPQTGDVDTSQFEGLLTECQILSPDQIGRAVGGGYADQGFSGAICRWVSPSAGGAIDITLNWFEWGDLNLEKNTSKRLGYETENQLIQGAAAFVSRDPQRPGICGVTAKSPSRGILAWWVEYQNPPAGDVCAGPLKLMEMVMDLSP